MSETVAAEEYGKCVTYGSSSSSNRIYEHKSVTISVRIPAWLYDKLKSRGKLNMSKIIRQLLLKATDGELTEEEELETKLDQLKEEMDKLQRYNSTLLKHGSYAKEYQESLKDKTCVTHNPFTYHKPTQQTLTQQEQRLVDETVRLRGCLAKQYAETLDKLLQIKSQKLT